MSDVDHLEVTRDGAIVKLRINGREDLALPLEAKDAQGLALQLQQAAADAKRWEQQNES